MMNVLELIKMTKYLLCLYVFSVMFFFLFDISFLGDDSTGNTVENSVSRGSFDTT